MRLFRIFSLLSIILIMLSACAKTVETTETQVPEKAVEEVVPSRPTSAPDKGEKLPPAVLAALNDLSQQENIPQEQVEVKLVVAQDWPDSCLGVARPEEMCLSVITPGYSITFVAEGVEYVYHTNESGSSMRRPPASPFSKSPKEPLPNDVVLFWKREGGIAGFCDELTILSDGGYGLVNCKAVRSAIITGNLTESKLEMLLAYATKFSSFEDITGDSAVADGMTISTIFVGTGKAIPTQEEKQTIGNFGAEMMGMIRATNADDPERDAAQAALSEFLNAINSGDFILGAKLYGGDTEILQSWNPDIKNDLPKWLELGCTQNGLQCLPIRSITYRGLDERGGYQFLIEFTAEDGSLFHQGPCCGEESEDLYPASFVFTMVKSGDNWQAMDLPPYLP